jgi:hypothetical protein
MLVSNEQAKPAAITMIQQPATNLRRVLGSVAPAVRPMRRWLAYLFSAA